MPDVYDYEQGFNLYEGLTFGKYKLVGMNITHHSIKLYNEYVYPTSLTFKTTSPTSTEKDVDELFSSFNNYVSGKRVIRTPSNRPYVCTFNYYHSETEIVMTRSYKKVTLKYKGFAKRVSNAVASKIE